MTVLAYHEGEPELEAHARNTLKLDYGRHSAAPRHMIRARTAGSMARINGTRSARIL